MVREYRVISALRRTAVPVAGPIALCDGPGRAGRAVLPDGLRRRGRARPPGRLARLDRGAGATRVCEQLIDTLVDLHAVEPGRGRPRRLRPSRGLPGPPGPALARRSGRPPRPSSARPRAAVVERLNATLPEQSRARDRARRLPADQRHVRARTCRRIAAVVDWEMATLGDPLTDVGLLVVYQTLAADDDFVDAADEPGRRLPDRPSRWSSATPAVRRAT